MGFVGFGQSSAPFTIEGRKESSLKKRATCAFPNTGGMVAVNPGGENGGWAMSPDEPCTAGKYCPYACPPGELMAQWDPEATSYAYPQSMNGGLYCNDDGTVSKPFKDKPYCYKGHGTISAVNKCSNGVAFCQTVLPGNEAMLIATSVSSSAILAVPGTEYWAATAAHYYINPPGVSTEEGCIWGDGSQPHGNWSPYVAGANTVENGDTFVKIAWNPIYTGESTFSNDLPKFGVRITCDGGGCNGLPCSIDPSTVSVNGVTSGNSATGAGGGNFCVVTVAKGSQAKIETFDVGQTGTAGGGKEDEAEEEVEEEPTSTPTPTPTPTPTSTIVEESTTEEPISTTTPPTRSTTQLDSSTTMTTSSRKAYISVKPHVMLEQSNSTSSDTDDLTEDEKNQLSTYKKTGSSGSANNNGNNNVNSTEEENASETTAAAAESTTGAASNLQLSVALAGVMAALSLLM